MKLLVLSDLHLEFAPFVPEPAAVAAADVVVLAGDISPGTKAIAWARQAFPGKPVVYVAGNHEFYRCDWDKLPGALREEAKKHDVHFLENEAVTIEGVRFVGATLWTDFALFGQCQYRLKFPHFGRSKFPHPCGGWAVSPAWTAGTPFLIGQAGAWMVALALARAGDCAGARESRRRVPSGGMNCLQWE